MRRSALGVFLLASWMCWLPAMPGTAMGHGAPPNGWHGGGGHGHGTPVIIGVAPAWGFGWGPGGYYGAPYFEYALPGLSPYGYAYYCPSAGAYYPRVPSCSEAWRMVPRAPW